MVTELIDAVNLMQSKVMDEVISMQSELVRISNGRRVTRRNSLRATKEDMSWRSQLVPEQPRSEDQKSVYRDHERRHGAVDELWLGQCSVSQVAIQQLARAVTAEREKSISAQVFGFRCLQVCPCLH